LDFVSVSKETNSLDLTAKIVTQHDMPPEVNSVNKISPLETLQLLLMPTRKRRMRWNCRGTC